MNTSWVIGVHEYERDSYSIVKELLIKVYDVVAHLAVHDVVALNNYKIEFIDITEETSQLIRGEERNMPRRYEVNRDEKGNLCNWLCDNDQRADFENFSKLFEIIEQIIV